MKKLNKLIALLCTFAMVVSVLPAAFADMTVPTAETVTVEPGETLEVDGKLINKGSIVANDSEIMVNGTMMNAGTIELNQTDTTVDYLLGNTENGTIVSENSSITANTYIKNEGEILVFSGNVASENLENLGTLYIENGMVNSGVVDNAGVIHLYAGDMEIQRKLENNGFVKVDYGDINVAGTVENSGDLVAIPLTNGAYGDITVAGILNNTGFIQADTLKALIIQNSDTIYANQLEADIVENAGAIQIGDQIYVGLVLESCFEDGYSEQEIMGIGMPFNEFVDICLDDLYIGDNFALSGVSLDSNVMAFVDGTPVYQGEMITGGGMLKYLASVPTYLKLFWKYIEEQNIEILLRWVDDDIKQVLDEDGNEMVIDEDYWHVGITNYGNMKVYFTGEQLEQMEAGEYNYTIVTSDGVEHPYRLVIG